MTSKILGALKTSTFLAIVMLAGTASAQDAPQSPNIFDQLFGGSERFNTPTAPQPRQVQATGGELMTRLDRLENQLRQLTGAIEQLQFRNQQLEGALRRIQEDSEYRFQELGSRGAARTPPPPAPAQVRPSAAPPASPPAAAGPGRRGDAFDPAQNPAAPGAPRVLGSLPPGPSAPLAGPDPNATVDEPPVGAPGGRSAGAPLDLSTLAGAAVADPTLAPHAPESPPAPRGPAAGGPQVATIPPSESPKDNFDLAYGYMLRRDYALAEDGFKTFLRRHPSDRMAPEAQYWLGEAQFQRQRYRDAAEAFLNVSTKYETTAKAPDALLRLGQSLAALGEKEAACASLGEVLRKYPRASVGVKQGVDREQKRVRC